MDECPFDTMKHLYSSLFLWMPLVATHTIAAIADPVNYDPGTRVFTLSSPQVTYAFGVNERGELQSLYWGGNRAPDDTLSAARSDTGSASFDPSTGSTPQEYAAWAQLCTRSPRSR